MPEQTIDLSIIIINWNGKELLDNCLESILSRLYRYKIEIIIVDNASSDDSMQMVANKYLVAKYQNDGFPSLKTIVNEENLGFNRANNVGIRLCSGRYILLLNNDTIIEDDAFDRMVDFMETHPDAGAMGPKVLNADRTFQKQCRRGHLYPLPMVCYMLGLHRVFPKNRLCGHYLQSFRDENRPDEVDVISGCCFLFRREVLDKVGLLDEQFFFYGDDCDYSLRIWQAGWKIYYVPDINIIHLKGGSISKQKKDFHLNNLFKSYLQYYDKHLAPKDNVLTRFIVHSVVRSGHFFLKTKNNLFGK